MRLLAALVVFATAGFTSFGQAQPAPTIAPDAAAATTQAPAPVAYELKGPVAPEAEEPAAEAPAKPRSADWKLEARLYHGGGGGAGTLDSLGCSVVPLRTVAIDPRVVPKRTVLYIAEMDGLRMSDGRVHDGLVYASDTGGGIKGSKIDLFTGHGKGSMKPAMPLNLKRLTVSKAGTFKGCPPSNRTYAENEAGRG